MQHFFTLFHIKSFKEFCIKKPPFIRFLRLKDGIKSRVTTFIHICLTTYASLSTPNGLYSSALTVSFRQNLIKKYFVQLCSSRRYSYLIIECASHQPATLCHLFQIILIPLIAFTYDYSNDQSKKCQSKKN